MRTPDAVPHESDERNAAKRPLDCPPQAAALGGFLWLL